MSAEPAASRVEAATKKHKKKCRSRATSQSDTQIEGKHKKKRKKCPNPPNPTPGGAVMVAVGDVALCSGTSEQNLAASAKYINGTPGAVAILGDLAYQSGTHTEFANCYDKYYGSFINRTYPTPGNHEYYNDCKPHGTLCGKADPYFSYFKSHSSSPAEVKGMTTGNGWYSYSVGTWKIYVLNSNGSDQTGSACGWVPCGPASSQYQWLQAALAADQKSGACSLAYWHHPLFNSGSKGGSSEVKGWWNLLTQYHAELVLNGHEHLYERFAPQTPNGVSDPQHGIREFIVGTGGAEVNHSTPQATANSQVRISNTVGVLKLTLQPKGYEFAYVDSHTGKVLDSGSGSCH